MQTPARGGYARGTKPARPGDLTAKLFNANQQRTEAEKRAKETPVDLEAVRRAAWRDGFDAGHEAGFIAGWDALASYLVGEGILMPDEADEDQGDEADHEADEN
jgi:hypothetical protein